MIILQNVKNGIDFLKKGFGFESTDTNNDAYNESKDFNISPMDDVLVFSSSLVGFKNTGDIYDNNLVENKNGSFTRLITGAVTDKYNSNICPHCGKVMYVNDTKKINIKDLPFGSTYTTLVVSRTKYYCDNCKTTYLNDIPFKCDNHRITKKLKTYIIDLLKTGNFSLKTISNITGVDRNIIKEIDKERLIKTYTVDGEGKELAMPKEYSKLLVIDEFKLHDGYKFATHIIDLETGHILWIAEGKKKKVVYDFMKKVGDDWMQHVEAVACDMNSDFEEAFKEKYPHITIVFDHFHIIKNFNEKVITKIRIDEEKRLKEEGLIEEAKMFKNSKHILFSSKETLDEKDKEVQENKVINKGSELFRIDEITRKGNYRNRYDELINNNELLLTVDIIKDHLKLAYECSNKEEMENHINEIIRICDENGNKHLLWFKKLLVNHYDGIVSYADYKISSGKIEGINNKIKTIRRQSYGLPDDEYFFLKLIDVSRN